MHAKILLIEDDMTIAQTTAAHLTQWDYTVEYVTDFKNILAQFTRFDPHLVLLDIMLPYFNGYYWCAELRKISKVPIIFLSSAADNMNIVMAMNMGADDFIPKPFDLAVLTAKVGAFIRRTYSFGGQLHVLEHRGALLNLSEVTLTSGNRKAALTKNECRLLQTLMEHAGQVVSREALMQALWESDSFIDDNTLTVNMARLRKKTDDIGLTDFILTKKGIGYMLSDEAL